jgi:hypothetical protein
MLEGGRRAPALLARKLVRVYGLSPMALPVETVRENASADSLAAELALLGYPGFAHLRPKARKGNPADILLSTLTQKDLEARTAEGLPWVVLEYPDMPRDYLMREARARNLQNRLGFAVILAQAARKKAELQDLEQALAESKLEREDTLCKELSEPERRWLREHRSEQARQRNLLSDLRPDTLRYVR